MLMIRYGHKIYYIIFLFLVEMGTDQNIFYFKIVESNLYIHPHTPTHITMVLVMGMMGCLGCG